MKTLAVRASALRPSDLGWRGPEPPVKRGGGLTVGRWSSLLSPSLALAGDYAVTSRRAPRRSNYLELCLRLFCQLVITARGRARGMMTSHVARRGRYRYCDTDGAPGTCFSSCCMLLELLLLLECEAPHHDVRGGSKSHGAMVARS